MLLRGENAASVCSHVPKFCLSTSSSLGSDSGGRQHKIDKAMATGTHSKRCKPRAMTRSWSCLSFASFTEQRCPLCWKDVMSRSTFVLHNTVKQWAPLQVPATRNRPVSAPFKKQVKPQVKERRHSARSLHFANGGKLNEHGRFLGTEVQGLSPT